jgi:hypothetical protein
MRSLVLILGWVACVAGDDALLAAARSASAAGQHHQALRLLAGTDDEELRWERLRILAAWRGPAAAVTELDPAVQAGLSSDGALGSLRAAQALELADWLLAAGRPAAARRWTIAAQEAGGAGVAASRVLELLWRSCAAEGRTTAARQAASLLAERPDGGAAAVAARDWLRSSATATTAVAVTTAPPIVIAPTAEALTPSPLPAPSLPKPPPAAGGAVVWEAALLAVLHSVDPGLPAPSASRPALAAAAAEGGRILATVSPTDPARPRLLWLLAQAHAQAGEAAAAVAVLEELSSQVDAERRARIDAFRRRLAGG